MSLPEVPLLVRFGMEAILVDPGSDKEGVSHHVNNLKVSQIICDSFCESNYQPWHPEPKRRYVNM